MYNPAMRRLRVRHHTGDENLEHIREIGVLKVSRGWGDVPSGIHVEVQPYGTTRPYRAGKPSPKGELSLMEDGAFVEFDIPADLPLRPYKYSVRNTAIIVTDQPLPLGGLQPVFVKVRRHWWEFWRSPWE
jgi:hypothetical protein